MIGKIKKPLALLLAFAMVTMLNIPRIDFGIGASAATITATEPENGNGTESAPYQIGKASELYWFADYVKNTDNAANAVLTADIVVNEDVLAADGSVINETNGRLVAWKTIGTATKPYTGTFDGGGHTVSGLYYGAVAEGNDYKGLFGYIGISGSVLNVGVVDTYMAGADRVGGVCGYNEGTIKNSYSIGTINCKGNAGGVCGRNKGEIEDCYAVTVVRNNILFGGVCGYNAGGNVKNCYYDSTRYSGNGVGVNNDGYVADVYGIKTEQFKNGFATHMMNEKSAKSELIWGQKLTGDDADLYPVMHTGDNTVYVSAGCAAPSNDSAAEGQTQEHEYDNGICTKCGEYKAGEYDAENDRYEISDIYQLYWFVEYVNNVDENINAVLTSDIKVNVNLIDKNGALKATDTSALKNWIPIGTVLKPYTGTFDGEGHTISGLYCGSGADYVGLFGCIGNGGTVSNVGVADSYLNGREYVGSICGKNQKGTISNSYAVAAVAGSATAIYVGGVCGNNAGGTITACYHNYTVCPKNDVGAGSESEKYTAEVFKNGKVAYLLNNSKSDGELVWGQTLSGDSAEAHPVCRTADNTVYITGGECKYYTNDAELSGKAQTHVYVRGICEKCGSYEEAVKNETTSKYEISNVGQLYWFAEKANSGESVDAVLTADITVNSNVINFKGRLNSENVDSFIKLIPAGTSKNPYTGTFDGQGHVISGLYYDGSEDNVGLFGYIGEGGSVSNLGIVGSYMKGMSNVGGICGYNFKGTIANSYTCAYVIGKTVGGICGKLESGIIKNCFCNRTYGNTKVSGNNTGGTQTGSYCAISSAFKNGSVTYYLNNMSSTGELVWGQILTGDNADKYPVSHTAANTVYYTSEAGECQYYTNNSELSGKTETHEHDNGICTKCGKLQAMTLNEETSTYEISNFGQLLYFTERVYNAGAYLTAKVALKADITANKNVIDGQGKLNTAEAENFISWTPIGTATKPYTGTFDGEGHTISGLYYDIFASGGLFGYVGEGGSVSNVGVVDSYFCGNNKVGGVCGYSEGAIENCYNKKSTVAGAESVGGVCGELAYIGSVSGCYNTGSVTGTDDVGGIFGYSDATSISECYNTGAISGADEVGGICGDSEGIDASVSEVYNTGSVKGTSSVGGIFGYSFTADISESYNTGKIEGIYDSAEEDKGYCVGGLTGNVETGSIADCYNSGEVSGNYNVGGIWGYSESANVSKVHNTGKISGDAAIGGICGDAEYVNVSQAYNTGEVSGNIGIGGVCGYHLGASSHSLDNCYNTGKVSGKEEVGGVCGECGGGIIKNSYSVGATDGDSEVGGICGNGTKESISNSYYDNTVYTGDALGTQKEVVMSSVNGKPTESFADGTVAYLLQSAQTADETTTSAAQVWGQTLTGDSKDSSPVLDSKAEKSVCKVKFATKAKAEYAAKYTNPNGTVELPAAPTGGSQAFYKWSKTNSADGEEFTAETLVAGDMTVWAVGAEKYGANSGEKNISAAYGVGVTQDLSEYTVFASYTPADGGTAESGTQSAGKFDYVIEKIVSGAAEITDSAQIAQIASISGDTLTAANTLSAGVYTITVKATAKKPILSLMADELDTEPFKFNVTLTVTGVPETTPSIAVDYASEMLTGFADGTYTVDGEEVTLTDSKVSATAYIGKTISVVKKASDANHTDSAPQTLAVPARPSAPTASNFTVVQPSVIGGTGSIEGITADMEYSTDGGKTWQAGTGVKIENIAGGTKYTVHYKATESKFKSANYAVSVNVFGAVSETTPNIAVDYANEMLTGFADGAYTIDGEEVTPTDGKLSADEYMGKTVLVVKAGNAVTTSDSEPQTLVIPARPSAPSESGFKVVQPSEVGGTGSIEGITADMEYSTDGGKTWQAGTGVKIENIAGGTKYAVRYKATESSFKSAEYKISVIAFGVEPADEVAPIGKYTGKVKIEKEVVENEVVFTISPLDGNSVSATLYLAEYDTIGNLTDKKLGTKSTVDGKTIIKVEKPKTSIYKLMLWDDDCGPIIAPVTALD